MRERKMKEKNLYLVTGEECSLGRTTIEVVEAAINGEVDIVQMREKSASLVRLKELGERLSDMCSKSGVIFIVNDDPMLAKEVGAHGVHLGQEDVKTCPVDFARDILGQDGIIGLSTHSVDEAKEGMRSGADYIAFGPVFPTKTKDYFIGKDDIPEVLGFSNKPVVLIGGINGGNISEVLSLGAQNIAMIRQITEAEDIEREVRSLKGKIVSSAEKKGVNVKINGEMGELEREMSIFEMIEAKGLKPERVVIEHNRRIVPKDTWAEVFLRGGDNIEILSFVGGG